MPKRRAAPCSAVTARPPSNRIRRTAAVGTDAESRPQDRQQPKRANHRVARASERQTLRNSLAYSLTESLPDPELAHLPAHVDPGTNYFRRCRLTLTSRLTVDASVKLGCRRERVTEGQLRSGNVRWIGAFPDSGPMRAAVQVCQMCVKHVSRGCRAASEASANMHRRPPFCPCRSLAVVVDPC